MATSEMQARLQRVMLAREREPSMNYIQLRDKIRSFNFNDSQCVVNNRGYNRVLLQVFGFTGHGKSSFINSCKFVLGEKYEMVAKAAAKDGGLTMARIPFKLTDTVTLVDNRGFSTMNELELGDIYAQLGNFIPIKTPVKWQTSYQEFVDKLEDSEEDPNFTDFIVPILVYSVKKGLSDEEMPEMQKVLNDCRKLTGIFPIIVLTHKTFENFFEVKNKFVQMGAEVVTAVENYTPEEHITTRGRHTDLLSIIYNALEDVKFYLEEDKNPKRERVERKKFLLKYANECHLNRGR